MLTKHGWTFRKQWKDEKIPDRHALLTCDSVGPQALKSFRECMEATGTYVLHGPTGSTHVWQMIDRHVGGAVGVLGRWWPQCRLQLTLGKSPQGLADSLGWCCLWIYIASKRKQHRELLCSFRLVADLDWQGPDAKCWVVSCFCFAGLPAGKAWQMQLKALGRMTCRT